MQNDQSSIYKIENQSFVCTFVHSEFQCAKVTINFDRLKTIDKRMKKST